jgi:hypothetical protein
VDRTSLPLARIYTEDNEDDGSSQKNRGMITSFASLTCGKPGREEAMSFKLPGTVAAAAFLFSMVGSGANAIPIQVAFNFVPTGALTANTGDVTTATTITAGLPDIVTQILLNNIGLVAGQAVTLTSPTPVTLGSAFTKSFTTALGIFTENLTVNLVTPGPTSLGVTASGSITGPAGFDPTSVFYSAAYTQNGGPGAQINASFNNSTVPPAAVPAVGGLPGLVSCLVGGLLFIRRRRNAAA